MAKTRETARSILGVTAMRDLPARVGMKSGTQKPQKALRACTEDAKGRRPSRTT
jgi:hypothetical protein